MSERTPIETLCRQLRELGDPVAREGADRLGEYVRRAEQLREQVRLERSIYRRAIMEIPQ